MEINLTVPIFRQYMTNIADKLVILYSKSEPEFRSAYNKLPTKIKLFLFEISTKDSEDDLVEVLQEIFNYYYSYKVRNAPMIEFTLRNSNHLKRFENFLSRMEIIHDNYPEDFIELFPQCPEVYWDKIDDLRETSFKGYRDSKQFTRCLTLSKKLSFGYEKLLGIEPEKDEDYD